MQLYCVYKHIYNLMAQKTEIKLYHANNKHESSCNYTTSRQSKL